MIDAKYEKVFELAKKDDSIDFSTFKLFLDVSKSKIYDDFLNKEELYFLDNNYIYYYGCGNNEQNSLLNLYKIGKNNGYEIQYYYFNGYFRLNNCIVWISNTGFYTYNVDIETFNSINQEIFRDKNYIYNNDMEIVRYLPDISSGFSLTSLPPTNNIKSFCRGNIIILDDEHIYVLNSFGALIYEKIDGVDVKTFKYFFDLSSFCSGDIIRTDYGCKYDLDLEGYFCDKNHIYYYGKINYGEKRETYFTKIGKNDNYEVLKYYFNDIFRLDKGIALISPDMFTIYNVDLVTFKAIQNRIFLDKNYVYDSSREIVQGMKPTDDIQLFLGGEIIKNFSGVFVGGDCLEYEKQEFLDVGTFDIYYSFNSVAYFRDKNKVYIYDYSGLNIIEYADPITFQQVESMDGLFMEDLNFIFYHGKLLKNSDSKTFVNVHKNLFKDSNNVYYLPTFASSEEIKILKGVNPNKLEFTDYYEDDRQCSDVNIEYRFKDDKNSYLIKEYQGFDIRDKLRSSYDFRVLKSI